MPPKKERIPMFTPVLQYKVRFQGRGSEFHRPVSMVDHHRSVKLEGIKVDYSSTLATYV